MKIVHIILSCFYKEGYGYQENILPSKHKDLGLETSIITYNGQYHILPKNITEKPINEVISYRNNNDIPVFILPKNKSFITRIPIIRAFTNYTKSFYDTLCKLSPDIIFAHGFKTPDHFSLIKYKKNNPNVKIFIDNHSDYYNTKFSIKEHIITKTYYRLLAKRLTKIVDTFWGVTPWRVQYLEEVYNIPSSKTNLLVMGGDENLIDWANRDIIKSEIRKKYNILPNDFVLITGGKIDKAKNIHLLIKAISKLQQKKIKLLIFGNYEPNIYEECNTLFGNNIINIGWIKPEDVYSYFLASDLGVFPGTHSVLWEQACASGLPCIFKDWGENRMKHLDVGGNCLFIKDISIDNLIIHITSIFENKNLYYKMYSIASTKAKDEFSYIKIAKRAINLT